MFENILATLYLATGLVVALSYYPQLKTLSQESGRAESCSMTTFAIWALCSLITMLYAIFIVRDAYFMFCSIANFVGCSAMLIMLFRRRFAHFH